MAAGIYKKGQGYWTRMMSGIAAGLLIVMGAVWVWDQFRIVRVGEIEPVYVSAGAAVVFMLVFGWLAFNWIGRKPRVVDFMIATEQEMKKVNWSSRREIFGSTWVVIGLTVLVAALIFILDYLIFSPLFRFIGVLQEAQS